MVCGAGITKYSVLDVISLRYLSAFSGFRSLELSEESCVLEMVVKAVGLTTWKNVR